MKNFTVIVFLLLSLNANACVIPPKEVYQEIDKTLLKSNDVLLLEVKELSFFEDGYFYSGIIREVLNGEKNVGDTYTLVFNHSYFKFESLLQYSFDKETDEQDFNFHQDSTFQNKESGRIGVNPSCKVEGIFKIGEEYLILSAKPYTTKSFELIKDKSKDEHYKYVKTFYNK